MTADNPQPRIAFQGERGAFSEEAAKKLLGEEIQLLPCTTFEMIFDSVNSGESDYCLAPIENSLAGSIHKNYDLLLEHDLKIVGEVYLRIIHNLIALPAVPLERVKRVYSHPVALAQCQQFFRQHKELEQIATYDTAGSVKMIVEQRIDDAAAIAGLQAAKVYGAHCLLKGIEDNKENYTRFLLLSKEASVSAAANKTSIVFSTENRPGTLFRCLAAFALRDIDLTKLESRPLHGRPWEYFFYADFLGNINETNCRNALSHLGEMATYLRVLGCYPRAQYQDLEGEQ